MSTISSNGTLLTLPTGSNDTLTANATAATLTNKTVDSASNTLTITNAPLSATNVNTLFNQDVRTSATPSFAGWTNTGSTATVTTREKHQSWTVTSTNSSTPITGVTIATTTGSTLLLHTSLTAYITASSGSDANKSAVRRLTSRIGNNAGTLTISTVEYLTNNDTGLDAVALTHVVSGANVLVQFTGIATDTITVGGITISFT